MDYTAGLSDYGEMDPDIFTSTKLAVAVDDHAGDGAKVIDYLNDTSWPATTIAPPGSPQYPKNMLGFTAACAFIIAVLGTSGNLLTIIALPMSKKLRTTATAFVVNLAVVELLFCVFILPMSGAQYLVLQHTGESLLSDRDCIFFAVTRYTLTQVELQTILAIALTRALAVSVPRLYSLINRPAIMGCYIAGIWIYSFLLKMPTAFELLGKYIFNERTMECDMSNDNLRSRLVMLIIEAIVPVVAIIVLYIFVFVMVIRRALMRKKKFSTVIPPPPQVKLSSARVQRASTRNKVPAPATSTTSTSSTSGGNQRKGSNSSFRSLKKMVSDSNLRARLTKQSSNVSQRLSTNRRDMRVARTIFIIFLFVLVCSVPVMMIHIIDRNVENPTRFLFLHILYWVQYCLNLVVYVLMNRQYRDAYVECMARVFPRFKRHQGRRFFWEKASISSKPAPHPNTSTRPRLDSAGNMGDSVASYDGDSPAAAPGGQGGAISPQGRLSAIPEGHSSSAANDSVFSDPQKKEVKDVEGKKVEEDLVESEDEAQEERALMDREHWLSKNGATADHLPENECKV